MNNDRIVRWKKEDERQRKVGSAEERKRDADIRKQEADRWKAMMLQMILDANNRTKIEAEQARKAEASLLNCRNCNRQP